MPNRAVPFHMHRTLVELETRMLSLASQNIGGVVSRVRVRVCMCVSLIYFYFPFGFQIAHIFI